jgi:hypothetical protein
MAKRAVKTVAVPEIEAVVAVVETPTELTTSPVELTTFKGFGADWKCRDFQYEIGGTYIHPGKVVRCGTSGGFHSCEHPLDTWNYYAPIGSRFAEVTAGGEISKGSEGEDSKLASAKITINVELSLGDLTRRAVKWVAEKARLQGNGQHTTGNYGHASAAGYRGHASAAGESGHASAAGNYGHASAAGYRGHASAAGNYGHASAAGYRGHASAAGESGHASAAGNYGHAEVKGKSSVAHAPGMYGMATACEGSAISLAAYKEDVWPPELVAVRSSMVGQNGIEAGKTYRLTTAGEFEQVDKPVD